MATFRKKPVQVEARRFETNNDDGSHLNELVAWIGDQGRHDNTLLYIDTLKGTMVALVGDWIIRGVEGEFCPCKPSVFKTTYEAVEEDDDR